MILLLLPCRPVTFPALCGLIVIYARKILVFVSRSDTIRA
jgi:hypothetical protein